MLDAMLLTDFLVTHSSLHVSLKQIEECFYKAQIIIQILVDRTAFKNLDSLLRMVD